MKFLTGFAPEEILDHTKGTRGRGGVSSSARFTLKGFLLLFQFFKDPISRRIAGLQASLTAIFMQHFVMANESQKRKIRDQEHLLEVAKEENERIEGVNDGLQEANDGLQHANDGLQQVNHALEEESRALGIGFYNKVRERWGNYAFRVRGRFTPKARGAMNLCAELRAEGLVVKDGVEKTDRYIFRDGQAYLDALPRIDAART